MQLCTAATAPQAALVLVALLRQLLALLDNM
jgi:hypothetical protein